jgi:hypothetical protein
VEDLNMNIFKAVASELLALFVDDGSFVLAVIAWVIGGAICLNRGVVPPLFEAVLLFMGIAGLLLENVTRTARAHAQSNNGR